MPSIRFRTSYRELKKVVPRYNGRGPTKEIRDAKLMNFLTKVRNIRQSEQADRGLIEFPFGLFENGKQLKTAYMTEKQACIRNKSIADLGMVWRRCGY